MKRTILFAILFVVAALAVVIAGYGIWRMQSPPAPTFGLATTASVGAGAQAQTGNAGIEIPDMALAKRLQPPGRGVWLVLYSRWAVCQHVP